MPATNLKSTPAPHGAEATLSEVFAPRAADGAVTGFVLSHLKKGSTVLWIQDRLSRQETGRPCLAGLPQSLDILHVDVSRPVDVLWAMEEGLRCRNLGAVLGEVWGDPPALDFTATKRLALRSEANRIPTWLIRRAAAPNLSAARNRWRVNSLASLGHPHDTRAPGHPQWQADLFRSRWSKPANWIVHPTPTGLTYHHGTAHHDTPRHSLAG